MPASSMLPCDVSCYEALFSCYMPLRSAKDADASRRHATARLLRASMIKMPPLPAPLPVFTAADDFV